MKLRSNKKEMSLPPIQGSSDDDLRINRPLLPPSLVNGTLAHQRKTVKNEFFKHFSGRIPKELQIQTIISLINGFNTFLLAGTGFGKSLIAIMFLLLFDLESLPVMIVINPLDALGDNQVLQLLPGITGINLTKTLATKETWDLIKKHHYRVIFVSPEMFLNSKTFQKIYYSTDFQKHLILKVVDEAHVIYSWGLVASGLTKGLQSHSQLDDVCEFRPSYGDLGQALTATDKVPVLLLSATCRPIAIERIWNSLKLTLQNRVEIQGKLVRPEIRYIRIYLTRPLDTAEDIAQFIPNQAVVGDDELPSTIIYSRSQDATFVVSKEVHLACGNPKGAEDGNSTCCRIYHASTGPQDKLTRASDYGKGTFRIISATTALGLGQDWHEVQSVIMMGAMDPDVIIQMAGRGGRGEGKDSLAIMLVEPERKKGQNYIEEFDLDANWNDDDQMHALCLTPVCLRVALNVDTLKGKIPLSITDKNFIEEKNRQDALGMKPCRCSVCDPGGAIELIKSLKTTNRHDFQKLLNQPTVETTIPDDSILTRSKMLPPAPKDLSRRPIPCPDDDPIRESSTMINLAGELMEGFDLLFKNYYPHGSDLAPIQLFNYDHVWLLVKNFRTVLLGMHLRGIFGSEPLPGTWKMIMERIEEWTQSESYQSHVENMAAEEARNIASVAEGKRIWEAYEQQQKEKEELKEQKKAEKAARVEKRLHKEALKIEQENQKKEKKRLKLEAGK